MGIVCRTTPRPAAPDGSGRAGNREHGQWPRPTAAPLAVRVRMVNVKRARRRAIAARRRSGSWRSRNVPLSILYSFVATERPRHEIHPACPAEQPTRKAVFRSPFGCQRDSGRRRTSEAAGDVEQQSTGHVPTFRPSVHALSVNINAWSSTRKVTIIQRICPNMKTFRHIIITGASSGIGEALAIDYAAPGVVLGLTAAMPAACLRLRMPAGPRERPCSAIPSTPPIDPQLHAG